MFVGEENICEKYKRSLKQAKMSNSSSAISLIRLDTNSTVS